MVLLLPLFQVVFQVSNLLEIDAHVGNTDVLRVCAVSSVVKFKYIVDKVEYL